jgi:hypothetical protein
VCEPVEHASLVLPSDAASGVSACAALSGMCHRSVALASGHCKHLDEDENLEHTAAGTAS